MPNQHLLWIKVAEAGQEYHVYGPSCRDSLFDYLQESRSSAVTFPPLVAVLLGIALGVSPPFVM